MIDLYFLNALSQQMMQPFAQLVGQGMKQDR